MAKRKDPLVWIVADGNQYDFSQAEKFGKLKAVTTGSTNIYNIPVMYRMVEEQLIEFDPEIDFLLITGHSILVWACIQTVLERPGVSQVNTLVYGARDKDYDIIRCRKYWKPASEELADGAPCPTCGTPVVKVPNYVVDKTAERLNKAQIAEMFQNEASPAKEAERHFRKKAFARRNKG